jgi:uncharacterized protein (DUF1778 family)
MTIRLSDGEKSLISSYAQTLGFSASDFMRRAALEVIEDELDLKAWDAAKTEFDANPAVYTADEIAAEFL